MDVATIVDPVVSPPVISRFVGIDVAKQTLDMLILPGHVRLHVSNTPAGWHAILHKLGTAHGTTRIVLEPTGSYHLGLTVALDEAGWTPVLVNARAVRQFAAALGQQAKTDRLDAWLLARYAETLAPTPRRLPTANERRVEALVARRADLVQMQTQEKNRQQTLPEFIADACDATLACFAAAITRVEEQIAREVAADPTLAARVALLQTVPGIGPLIGPLLAVRLPELERLTGPKLATLVGVAPVDRASGTKRGKTMVRGGRADVRSSLYLGMMRAKGCDPVLAARYRHLTEELGKAPTAALLALIRWLLGVMHMMLRENIPWQETRIATSFVKEKRET
jgi:transposase